jgi:hypothetical protein
MAQRCSAAWGDAAFEEVDAFLIDFGAGFHEESWGSFFGAGWEEVFLRFFLGAFIAVGGLEVELEFSHGAS